ncbi:MAG: hypothetical protein EOO75_09935, partial [Myxococcales bacterium]
MKTITSTLLACLLIACGDDSSDPTGGAGTAGAATGGNAGSGTVAGSGGAAGGGGAAAGTGGTGTQASNCQARCSAVASQCGQPTGQCATQCASLTETQLSCLEKAGCEEGDLLECLQSGGPGGQGGAPGGNGGSGGSAGAVTSEPAQLLIEGTFDEEPIVAGGAYAMSFNGNVTLTPSIAVATGPD